MRSMTLFLLILFLSLQVYSQTESRPKAFTPPPPLPEVTRITEPKEQKPGVAKKRVTRRKSTLGRKLRTQPVRKKANPKTVSPTTKEATSSPDTTKERTVSNEEASSGVDEKDLQKSDKTSLSKNLQSTKSTLGENERIPFMQNSKETKKPTAQQSSSWINVLGAVGIVLGLIFLGAWVTKKYGLFGVEKADRTLRC